VQLSSGDMTNGSTFRYRIFRMTRLTHRNRSPQVLGSILVITLINVTDSPRRPSFRHRQINSIPASAGVDVAVPIFIFLLN